MKNFFKKNFQKKILKKISKKISKKNLGGGVAGKKFKKILKILRGDYENLKKIRFDP